MDIPGKDGQEQMMEPLKGVGHTNLTPPKVYFTLIFRGTHYPVLGSYI